MTTAAVQMLFPEARTEFATVLTRSGRRARLKTPSGERGAEVAASCMISPAPGDRVLVAHAGDEAYVLSVLRPAVDGEARVTFDQDVSFEVLEGRLRIVARDGVEVVSPKTLSIHVQQLAAHAQEALFAFRSLDLAGDSLVSTTKKIRVVASTLDTVAGRIYQRAVNFLRRTDELDRVEAKNIDLRAEQLLHLHGENSVSTADQLVKIDAAQVHVG